MNCKKLEKSIKKVLHYYNINLFENEDPFINKLVLGFLKFHIGETNNKLMAAAPEMLEAFIMLYKYHQYNKPENPHMVFYTHHIPKEIIEKATGLSIEVVLNERD